MTDTRAALDEAIRAHMAADVDPDGEVIVAWVTLAATRSHDGGGVVIYSGSDEAMPRWQVRGILDEMRAVIDRGDPEDDLP